MNRLHGEVSPYLAQHADNPVHWWPWRPEAFAEARRLGKPVLLSVGYSACHWCHVMAHESFEDADTAALMNALFVNIKVDREERPDVDQVYMAALHALGQQGGWPLTMFLDADGRPFWGGTYFPKDARYGQPAFKAVLKSVAAAHAGRRGDIASNAEAILAAISGSAPATPAAELGIDLLDRLADRGRDVFDPVNGGLKGAPKFPNPGLLEMMWRASDRTGDESIRLPVLTTLRQMALGGIHDHIGGGFSRYSVDDRWLVPHFEKMLYDNAQLLPLYALAAVRTGDALYREAAAGIVDWLMRDMITADGAFAASEDADSLDPHGRPEEGAFYTWIPAEVVAVLGEDAEEFAGLYDVAEAGNFEGRSIPNRLRSGFTSARSALVAGMLERLRTARDRRPRPGRDDKILADWNGLAIAGLARAGTLLDAPEWIAAAHAVHRAVKRLLADGDGLAHASRLGKVVRPGFASDHAGMAIGALALVEAGVDDAELLEDAARWVRRLRNDYVAESGWLAMTPDTAADLPIRPAPTQDDALPNANGLAVEACIRLFGLTGQPSWRDDADRLLDALTPAILGNPFGHASLLNAFDLRLRRADIAVHAAPTDPLAVAARSIPYPNRTLLRRDSDRPGQRYATVCVDGRCSLPIVEVAQLLERVRIDLGRSGA